MVIFSFGVSLGVLYEKKCMIVSALKKSTLQLSKHLFYLDLVHINLVTNASSMFAWKFVNYDDFDDITT
jgi:hypothetical protein